MVSMYYADLDEIRRGRTTDIYFERTRRILEKKGLDKVRVVAEVTTGGLPENWDWAVLCGVEEVAALMEGVPVDVHCMPEGTIFRPRDVRGIKTPVAIIEGVYSAFSIMETPLLGLLCQSSGIATAAARVKKAAGERQVLSFGIRRMHPVLSPMIDRSAYIGGVDGVSSVLAAERLGLAPSGTMPHSLIVVMGDQLGAWRTFDENMPEDVQRIALVDTYLDEKTESVMAAEALGKRLWGVRLDTPKSRRGDLGDIVREVRWELDIRGFGGVKIFVSGGLGEESVAELVKVGVDGFGVGTRISNAPTVDFALDIVEKEGRPVAKRGKFGGKKSVWRCAECSAQLVTPYRIAQPSCPTCGGTMDSMLVPLLRGGEVVAELPPASRIRERVIGQLGRCELHFSSGR